MNSGIPRSGRVVAVLLLLALLFAVVLTNPKLIWTDEFLQFAFGAYSDSLEALSSISLSISDLNHGQTGFHMFLNHLFLKWFGASYFVLRFPSAMACTLGLLAGYCFLGNLGFSFLSRVLFLLGVGLSQLNLEHGGEARPYIFLQATVFGFLWAWERYLAGRRLGIFLLTVVCALGILSHPFFVAYAGLSVALSPLFFPVYRARLLEDLRLSSQLLALLASGGLLFALFLLVGKVSWFQTFGHKFHFDSYAYIGHDKGLLRFMIGTFYFPFGKAAIPALGVLFVLALLWSKREGVGLLLRWFIFFSVLLAVTQGLLVWQVLKSEYWLLQRQWIAGSALAILALLVLVEVFIRRLIAKPSLEAYATVLLLLVAVPGMSWKVSKNLQVTFPPVVPLERAAEYRAALDAKKQLEIQEYLNLAHLNLLQGGRVWPVFRRYYSPVILP